MSEPIAVLDACVLYPAPLRDLLMHLTLVDAFRARWTEAIHDEWIRNLLVNRPELRPEQLERTRRLMNAHARDALVENYESLIDALDLPDEDDRHVLAAAIHVRAEVIVTFNLRDFPPETLAPYSIYAVHPDEFIMSLLETDADLVRLAAERQWRSLKNPPKSLVEFLEILRHNGLAKSVERLRILLEKNFEQR